MTNGCPEAETAYFCWPVRIAMVKNKIFATSLAAKQAKQVEKQAQARCREDWFALVGWCVDGKQ